MQLAYWAVEIASDYPNITIAELTAIIRKGVKGGYAVKSNHVNLMTIYDWIKQAKPTLPKNWYNSELTPEQWALLTPEQVRDKKNNDIRKSMGI